MNNKLTRPMRWMLFAIELVMQIRQRVDC